MLCSKEKKFLSITRIVNEAKLVTVTRKRNARDEHVFVISKPTAMPTYL